MGEKMDIKNLLKEAYKRFFEVNFPKNWADLRGWLSVLSTLMAMFLLWYVIQPNGTCNVEYEVNKPFIDGLKNHTLCIMAIHNGICGGQPTFGAYNWSQTMITGGVDIATRKYVTSTTQSLE